MRSVSLAILVMLFLISSLLTPSIHSQAVSKNRASSSSAVPMQTVKNQIEKQQSEIEALRMRLATLQREYEDLAQKIADQSNNSDDDDDDDADIPNVPSLRVHSFGKSNRSATPAAWPPRAAVWIDETKSNCRSRRVH